MFGESSHRNSEMARPTQAPLHDLLSSQSGGWPGSDARAVFIDYRTYLSVDVKRHAFLLANRVKGKKNKLRNSLEKVVGDPVKAGGGSDEQRVEWRRGGGGGGAGEKDLSFFKLHRQYG